MHEQMSYGSWAVEEDIIDDFEGDCPGCVEGILDERWEVNKDGEEFAMLICPFCGWHD